MRIIKKILLALLILFLIPPVAALCIYVNYHVISFAVQDQIFSEVHSIPEHPVALVLGAGIYKPELWTNYWFNYRMEATARLYHSKKAKKIIVSGIYSQGDDDEVGDMRDVLITFGVPDSDIITDKYGIRTWASIQSAKEIHHVQKMIIVSQKPHLERALFISNCLGIEASGFVAEPAPRKYLYWKIREYLSRVKSVIDCLKYKLSFSHI